APPGSIPSPAQAAGGFSDQTVHLIAHPTPEADPQTAYDSAVARLEELRGRLTSPLPPGERRLPPAGGAASSGEPEANWDRRGFCQAVRQALEYIRAGEIFQVVLSRRFHLPAPADALTIYRTLRALNPSPYLFYLDFGPFQLVGSSPEMLTRLEGRKAEVRPIAGTRPRGSTAEADAALARELLADEKERAEHVMLVDLGRNDLGRVCRYGSVEVPEFMVVERYSHVMHLVSGVQGELDPRYGAVDLVGATFPAGTVTGAPKVRAMEIIRELEPVRRGPYAGAVGYFDLAGNLDLCLAIRTLLVQSGRVYIQAGAGIVADSDPEREFMETAYKAQALVEAVRLAGGMRFAGGRAG
ncbi:MAG: anthranilate synthase component I family protein, partial [Bacillota bacterium]|nr:anthranilate synthase component I family protein [Bacillota bacterium]